MAGKINVIKINRTPKLNYLIHSLLLEVSLSYFRWFDRITKTFICNGKRPRLHLAKTFYYYVFHLGPLAHWSLPPDRAPPWYCTEQSVLARLTPLQSLSTKLAIEAKAHPIIAHLKLMWTKVARMFNLDPYLNASFSICLNPVTY